MSAMYMLDSEKIERMNREQRNENFRRKYPKLAELYAAVPLGVDLELHHQQQMREKNRMKTMATERFEVTLGVVAGYRHENEFEGDARSVVAATWDAAGEAELARGGLYVPAVVSASAAVYRREWGCPEAGEVAVTVTGARNPAFDADSEKWRESLLRIVRQVKEALKQSTAHLILTTAESCYLAAEKD